MSTSIRKRRPRRMMNQINVVPYLDVLLVLLVIFMVTAPLTNPGQIELPSVGQSLTAPVLPIEVTINADRALAVRDRAQGGPERELSKAELVKFIQGLQSSAPDRPVVIAADKAVRYEAVLEVMDLLQQNQVKRVGLLAMPRTP
ncbi:MAG: biopolymer transporter ExbD [Rhodocyclaceae bacterium]|jgi:biopolymer transport protein TolR|nr:biopolymer transporter ExbD [Rhodocyclaceae bacterium]MCE2979149.1 biopolymer transporter ExbD [Betaproteobacteria bacterium]MCA3074955.1 biopolymer transporter ExbD [Rhodocyclaceae bacterium]MCA3090433.1 biopolymer transporter ExbD [Rhodocyclaceae bacterium]MCA3094659.1 biopolymer transporter ExbD [Rhodocyclaceae bacterium]